MERLGEATRLRKDGEFDKALPILLDIIDSQEKESIELGKGVLPSPYEEAAKLYRKTKDRKSEIDILERFARQKHTPGKKTERLYQRLVKTYDLDGQIESQEIEGETIQLHVGYNVPVDQCPVFIETASIIDVETTGLTPEDDIIELGIITFRFSKLTAKIIDKIGEYQSLHEPSCNIGPAAKKVHGLSLSDVKGYCIDKEAVQEILDNSNILIAHNAGFDRRFMAKYFPKVNSAIWYCTMSGIPWKSYGFPSRKLQDIVNKLGIEMEGDAHRGLNDAKAVLSILQKQNDGNGNSYLLDMLNKGPMSSSSERSRKHHGPVSVTFKINADGTVSTEKGTTHSSRNSPKKEQKVSESGATIKGWILFLSLLGIIGFVFIIIVSKIYNALFG